MLKANRQLSEIKNEGKYEHEESENLTNLANDNEEKSSAMKLRNYNELKASKSFEGY